MWRKQDLVLNQKGLRKKRFSDAEWGPRFAKTRMGINNRRGGTARGIEKKQQLGG